MQISSDFITVIPLDPSSISRKPLSVSLVRQQDKAQLLAASRLFKNAGYYIDRDFAVTVRLKRNKLQLVRKELKKLNPKIKCSPRSDNLQVQNDRFQWFLRRRLLHSNGKGVKKNLNGLMGGDVFSSIEMLSMDTLPKDHFTTPSTHINT